MRVVPGVYLVGGKGPGLSAPWDCNVYVVDGGTELALIDAGSGQGTSAILGNVGAHGLNLQRVKKILLTHAHADHSGGARALAKATGAKVLGPALERSLIEAGTDHELGLDIARDVGIYEPNFRYEHCRVDVDLGDGDEVIVGRLHMTAVRTPGHSRGSMCYFCATGGMSVLFSGDTVSADGKLHFNSPDVNVVDLRLSLRRLRDLCPDTLCPGHGPFAAADAVALLDEAMARLAGITMDDVARGNPFFNAASQSNASERTSGSAT
jgi:hydroxyacylglutathione hydrolase